MVQRHIDRAAAVQEKKMPAALDVNVFYKPVRADASERKAPETPTPFEKSTLATAENDRAHEVCRGVDVHIGYGMFRFITVSSGKLQMVRWMPGKYDDALVRDAIGAAVKGTHRHDRSH